MVWAIQGSNGTVLSGGNYNNNTTISIPYCLPSDCYTLVLDYTGNAGWGNGNIMITSLGAVLVNASLFPGGNNLITFGINSPGCENSVISGCMDPTATNYNSQATIDDGTCQYPSLCPNGGTPGTFYICTFSNGSNVAIQIVSDEGAILFEQIGFANGQIMNIPVCIDSDACYTVNMWNTVGETGWYNGYWWLNTANGQVATNSLDANLNSEVSNFSLDNSCAPIVIEGCTNPIATNYNPNATLDNGTCILPEPCNETLVSINVTGGSFPNEVSWSISGTNGTYITGGAPFNGYYCLPDDCYTVTLTDSWGDGWNAATMTIGGDGAVLFNNTLLNGYSYNYALGINTANCEVVQPPVYGCTDPAALNFNAFATIEDNSCVYPFACDEGIPAHLYVCAFSNASELSLEIVGSDGSVLFSQQGFTNFQILNLDLCLDPNICYTATMSNLSGNPTWYNGYWWLTQSNIQVVYNESLNEGLITEDYTFGLNPNCGGTVVIFGCTDPLALNYNQAATTDDGSCVYPSTDCNASFEVIQDANGQDIFWIVTDYGNAVNTYQFVWNFGDINGNFSYEPYPNFTYTADGDYLLCLSIYQVDPNGWITCEDSICFLLSSSLFDNAGGGGIQEMEGFTINVIDASQVGIIESNTSAQLNVYPNPTSGIFNLTSSQTMTSPSQIQILDLNGRIVFNKQFNLITAGQQIQIDLSNMASGVYVLQIANEDSIITKKITKD